MHVAHRGGPLAFRGRPSIVWRRPWFEVEVEFVTATAMCCCGQVRGGMLSIGWGSSEPNLAMFQTTSLYQISPKSSSSASHIHTTRILIPTWNNREAAIVCLSPRFFRQREKGSVTCMLATFGDDEKKIQFRICRH